MSNECFILQNTNPRIINNYPIILEDANELIEYLENYNTGDVHTIIYETPLISQTYCNLNGDLVKGDFTPIDED